ATFLYQTTDPATNALTGSPNAPATIPPSGRQTFLVAFTPTAAFGPADVLLAVSCANVPAAPVIAGVNSLVLAASDTPVPDIVALAATPANDGIVAIPGVTGSAAFSVAAVNVGAGGAITASADTGPAALPVTLTICETDPVTSACLAPPT